MESQVAQEHKKVEPLHFRQEVTIQGLPYYFEGDVPYPSKKCHWSVIVPNWEEQVKIIDQNTAKFDFKKGSVGNLSLVLNDNHAKLTHIATKTWTVSPGSPYQNALGVGSFLLRNFTTFADLKKLTAYLELNPDENSPLSNKDTVKWYERNGFRPISKIPNSESLAEKHVEMVRYPQQLTISTFSQPIASILRRQNSHH